MSTCLSPETKTMSKNSRSGKGEREEGKRIAHDKKTIFDSKTYTSFIKNSENFITYIHTLVVLGLISGPAGSQ